VVAVRTSPYRQSESTKRVKAYPVLLVLPYKYFVATDQQLALHDRQRDPRSLATTSLHYQVNLQASKLIFQWRVLNVKICMLIWRIF